MKSEHISDTELKIKALAVLNKNLGAANTIRFLSLYNMGKQDYMEMRDELFKGMSARQVFNAAADFWEKREAES